MKNLLLLFALSISLNIYSQKTGINTDFPTATIDINGDLRIRNIQKGLVSDSILCVDANGYTLGFTEFENEYYKFWGKRPKGK